MQLLEVYGPVPGCECFGDEDGIECGEQADVALLMKQDESDASETVDYKLFLFCRAHHVAIRQRKIHIRFRLED